MNLSDFRINTASDTDILKHLSECSSQFSPALDSTVDLGEYAAKLASHAVTFELWVEKRLAGLVAAYFNNVETGEAYISHVCVLKDYLQSGIASHLMSNVVNYGVSYRFQSIKLQVHCDNETAILLYRKFGFEIFDTLEMDNKFIMIRKI